MADSADNSRRDSQPTASPGAPEPLHARFRSGRPAWMRLWVLWLALIAVALAAAWMLMRPAPPKTIVIATSSRAGPYYQLAMEYADAFAKNGVFLEVRETAGTVENYRLLQEGPGTDGRPGASLAMVAGGQAPKDVKVGLRSIASLYLEPVWVFYRGGGTDRLSGLAGKRVAIGAPGGGARALALRLLHANGMADDPDHPGAPASSPATAPSSSPSTAAAPPDTQPGEPAAPARPAALVPMGGRVAATALEAGEIDAAFIIAAPDSPLVAELLAAERTAGIHLMSFERHEAYARRFPYLADVKLPRGVVDLARDLPPRDTYLLAPAANLVAREDLHPSLVPLLLHAVTSVPPPRELLVTGAKFPNTEFGEFKLDPAAREYFRSGPPLLQRFLPFWVASLVDRMKILLLPLITLLLPLARVAPPLYVWNIRSRIYRWYRVLRHIDDRLRESGPAAGAGAPPEDFAEETRLLDKMDREVAGVKVPLSYMAEFYTLRMHADFLRQEIRRRREGESAPPVGG